jgi:type II restriction/modification system DNA methylase subunit YeeA
MDKEQQTMTKYTPTEFFKEWQQVYLSEKQVAQSHFEAVCRLVGHPPPHQHDPEGAEFSFEYPVEKLGGGRGYVDVFYKDHFAIEYKTRDKYKIFDEAYQQLQQYREGLQNPPLLVVCDIANWEIHTNWVNSEKKVYKFTNADILINPECMNWLRDLFFAPERLRPERSREDLTEQAASYFADIADDLLQYGLPPERSARFINRIVFCLFAEDIGLLPIGVKGQREVFSEIVEEARQVAQAFKRYTQELFDAMADGGMALFRKIPYFDGLLFENAQAEDLRQEGLEALWRACQLDWSSVEPAIFGTLFERVLDPAKRAQLGAHYTGKADIVRIVEPVLIEPLRDEWVALREQAVVVRARYDAAKTDRDKQTALSDLDALRQQMLLRVRTLKVLDPACGSGNFLYVALQLLKDLEREIIFDPVWNGLPTERSQAHPRQLYGIEKDPVAHALASIVVWIGYLQWHWQRGERVPDTPILEPLHDHILNTDAVLTYGADGQPTEPAWLSVDVIVGNPPFLGGKRLRAELKGTYIDDLFKIYAGRVPREADYVSYWFEKARAQIEGGQAKRVGLLATNSIRQPVNRKVLERIKETGDIFMAWSDLEWTLEGASVNISAIGFDDGSQKVYKLDGAPVTHINSDFQNTIDATQARKLAENANIAFMADTKGGAFDIHSSVAKTMLNATNKSGRSNSDVVRPWVNGADIARQPSNTWIIDFGVDMPVEEAQLYEKPFEHVQKHVYPKRQQNRRESYRLKWWIHAEPRPPMRKVLANLDRYIATVIVAKHRLFVWLSGNVLPDHQLYIFARQDDYFWGILHSRLHELWTLRLGSTLEDRPRYVGSTCFDTFPFPYPPGGEPTDASAYQAISAAAKMLREERDAWLNPPGSLRGASKKRTLTHLYNAVNVFRGHEQIKVPDDAANFAPRLMQLHQALDEAVCDAYGWGREVLDDDEAMLRRLLSLNLERAER